MLDYSLITKKFYAAWLDCNVENFSGGMHYIRSLKRDKRQKGYSNRYPLYMCKTDHAIIISYSSKLQGKIDQMKKDLPALKDLDTGIIEYLDEVFPGKIQQQINFIFERQIPHPVKDIVSLTKNDYQIFYDFRLALDGNVWDGMKEYFKEIAAKGYCIAKMIDGKAVSMTDAPEMPFMREKVQEAGIATLPDYRRKGYAREAVSACILKLIADGKCPQASCNADNHASEKLAYSVGFKKFCDVYLVVI